MENLTDYFVRDKISLYHPTPKHKGTISKDYEDDYFIRSLEEFVLKNTKLNAHVIVYPDDYPQGKTAILTDRSRSFMDENQKVTLLEEYKEEVKQVVETTVDNVELEMDLDLGGDLDFSLDEIEFEDTEEFMEIADYTSSDSMSVNMLRMFEMEEDEEGGIFNNAVYYVAQFDNIRSEQEDINMNPEKYNKVYDELTTKVRLTANKLTVDVTDLGRERSLKLVDFINNCVTDKKDLSAIEFVKKIGTQYDNTGIYVKDVDVEKLREIVDKQLAEV